MTSFYAPTYSDRRVSPNIVDAMSDEQDYELRYRSLFNCGRGFIFPCDGHGQVDVDKLSDQALENDQFAQAVVRNELSQPLVHRRENSCVNRRIVYAQRPGYEHTEGRSWENSMRIAARWSVSAWA